MFRSSIVAQNPASMRRIVRTLAAALLALPSYGLVAYVLVPVSWKQYQRLRSPEDAAWVTHTIEGIPGDPLNVAVVGGRDEVVDALTAAGWIPADRITLSSGFRDAASLLFHRPYCSAPVSTHLLWNRPQDLAFEQIVDGSPRRRHHVRFWQATHPADPRDTVWIGAATYDTSVGFSSYTGELMHHIDSRVDEERDKLVEDLRGAGRLAGLEREAVRSAGGGRNGGGDEYVTDGRLARAILKPAAYSSTSVDLAGAVPISK